MKSARTSGTRGRMRRAAALLGGLSMALALVAGCSSDTDDAAAAEQSRTITTDRGPVTVPHEAKRIVVLSGSMADYLYAIDAPVVATDTRIIGVTNLDGGFPPHWADKARAQGTKALPTGAELNIEAVAEANPDLIIGGGQGITAVQADKLYDKLTAIAPTVLVPTKVTNWQDQLRMVAEAAGRADRVPDLLKAYQDKAAQVKASAKVPPGKVVYLLSVANKKPYLLPPSAALPAQLAELGFVADDVLAKAGNPPLFGSGDSFEVSLELLDRVADAPVAFVIPVGGPNAAELGQNPLYARLPAFRDGKVFELPTTSYRPDYHAALNTLDVVAQKLG
ncbi:iron complex transport system substrate-binding protein [Nocardia tenerifensis]|uniref:Iron complex transport system substrate-binding protein n=1 Tax=Nocardia tenerifensis TaxID=228006 RepID=A0A318K8V7_9NOCA|nr:ABC transporter substrate-binding protein [Nocardia tenerifensis]PXX69333.1 iron complex transport system substrate-binding protein [Nocardia tenerifensis]